MIKKVMAACFFLSAYVAHASFDSLNQEEFSKKISDAVNQINCERQTHVKSMPEDTDSKVISLINISLSIQPDFYNSFKTLFEDLKIENENESVNLVRTLLDYRYYIFSEKYLHKELPKISLDDFIKNPLNSIFKIIHYKETSTLYLCDLIENLSFKTSDYTLHGIDALIEINHSITDNTNKLDETDKIEKSVFNIFLNILRKNEKIGVPATFSLLSTEDLTKKIDQMVGQLNQERTERIQSLAGDSDFKSFSHAAALINTTFSRSLSFRINLRKLSWRLGVENDAEYKDLIKTLLTYGYYSFSEFFLSQSLNILNLETFYMNYKEASKSDIFHKESAIFEIIELQKTAPHYLSMFIESLVFHEDSEENEHEKGEESAKTNLGRTYRGIDAFMQINKKLNKKNVEKKNLLLTGQVEEDSLSLITGKNIFSLVSEIIKKYENVREFKNISFKSKFLFGLNINFKEHHELFLINLYFNDEDFTLCPNIFPDSLTLESYGRALHANSFLFPASFYRKDQGLSLEFEHHLLYLDQQILLNIFKQTFSLLTDNDIYLLKTNEAKFLMYTQEKYEEIKSLFLKKKLLYKETTIKRLVEEAFNFRVNTSPALVAKISMDLKNEQKKEELKKQLCEGLKQEFLGLSDDDIFSFKTDKNLFNAYVEQKNKEKRELAIKSKKSPGKFLYEPKMFTSLMTEALDFVIDQSNNLKERINTYLIRENYLSSDKENLSIIFKEELDVLSDDTVFDLKTDENKFDVYVNEKIQKINATFLPKSGKGNKPYIDRIKKKIEHTYTVEDIKCLIEAALNARISGSKKLSQKLCDYKMKGETPSIKPVEDKETREVEHSIVETDIIDITQPVLYLESETIELDTAITDIAPPHKNLKKQKAAIPVKKKKKKRSKKSKKSSGILEPNAMILQDIVCQEPPILSPLVVPLLESPILSQKTPNMAKKTPKNSVFFEREKSSLLSFKKPLPKFFWNYILTLPSYIEKRNILENHFREKKSFSHAALTQVIESYINNLENAQRRFDDAWGNVGRYLSILGAPHCIEKLPTYKSVYLEKAKRVDLISIRYNQLKTYMACILINTLQGHALDNWNLNFSLNNDQAADLAYKLSCYNLWANEIHHLYTILLKIPSELN